MDGAGVVLSLESRSSDALAAACLQLKGLLPTGALISEHQDSTAINTPTARAAAAPASVPEAAAAAAAAAAGGAAGGNGRPA